MDRQLEFAPHEGKYLRTFGVQVVNGIPGILMLILLILLHQVSYKPLEPREWESDLPNKH